MLEGRGEKAGIYWIVHGRKVVRRVASVLFQESKQQLVGEWRAGWRRGWEQERLLEFFRCVEAEKQPEYRTEYRKTELDGTLAVM